MSKWTNVRKFDFVKGKYTNSYYKLSDFDYFIDSEFGSDSNDGLTPETAFKTLSKITTLGSSIYKDDLVVACSGFFKENIQPNCVVYFIGVSGYNGKAVYENTSTISYSPTNKGVFYNFDISGHFHLSLFANTGGAFVNCYLHDGILTGYTFFGFSLYYCVLEHLETQPNQGAGTIYVYNSTILEPKFSNQITFIGNYNHIQYKDDSSHTYRLIGDCNIYDTISRYFIDDTETTPADLYIDSSKGNYGIVETFTTPIWDKQTQQYITKNPLYNNGEIIGCGKVTLALTANNASLKKTSSGGEATYSNMQNVTPSSISRIDDEQEGTVLSGVQDLGRVMNGVIIEAISSFDTNNGVITKRLQHSIPSEYQATDFYIQFGQTQVECNSMEPILCEFGKVITYSISNGQMYGNSEGTFFNPNQKRVASFRYFKINIKAKTI